MPSEHDVRQRASICQDCWFWQEMSCALANPNEGASCANRRPVRGRARRVEQAPLVPVSNGHGEQVAARAPFGVDAPEATFSLVQLCEAPAGDGTTTVEATVDLAQPVRSAPPRFRDIRAGRVGGRAAAATRAPVAEVRIPASQVEAERLFEATPAGSVAPVLPGMEQLVERVRQRTAARLSRSGALTSA